MGEKGEIGWKGDNGVCIGGVRCRGIKGDFGILGLKGEFGIIGFCGYKGEYGYLGIKGF